MQQAKTTAEPGAPGEPRPLQADAATILIRQLVTNGVEYVFLNPGTDTAPLQEALLALGSGGETVPRVVLCPHEAVALAASHAYYAATGRPQVVMVHVDVGTQNLGAMLHNAARANAGVVIIAGRTPISSHGEHAGGRDSAVHWMQDVPDQAGVVRPYVKAAMDLASPNTLARDINRAFQLATSSPPGPVYLTAHRELLLQPVPAQFAHLPPRRYGPAWPPAPAPAALAAAARALAGAERPVIVTTRSGQRPEAVEALVAVAELIGARVVDDRERVNFPSDHPAYLRPTAAVRGALAEADVLLLVDAPIPWIPTKREPSGDATIISLDVDPVRSSMARWSFPVDINVHTEPLLGLRQLLPALAAHRSEFGRRWEQRRSAIIAAGAAPGEPAGEEGGEADGRIRTAVLAAALNQVLDPHDIVVEEATTNHETLRACLDRTVPGTYFRSGGSGLGWGLGAALGVKLAEPSRRVISIVGDGAFLFSAPAPALWALHAAGAPVLVVVLQNGGYAASRAPVFGLFPDGRSASSGEVLGTLFGDAPDFATLAQACHAHGAHVYAEDDLVSVLCNAIERVDHGRSAVVVAHVSSLWIPAEQPRSARNMLRSP